MSLLDRAVHKAQTNRMNMKRQIAVLFVVFFAAAQTLFGISIVPEKVIGKADEIGATSHDSMRCVLWSHFEPQNLIQGYFQLSGPLQKDLSAHLNIKSGTNTLVAVCMGAMSSDKSQTRYNFVLRRDLLKDSYISIFAAGAENKPRESQLNLSTLRILTEQEYEHLDLDKALRGQTANGASANASNNTPRSRP
jgi:hypothetical protein